VTRDPAQSAEADVDRAIDRELASLEQEGFTQEQWRALINVFSLAKSHPAFDAETARVVLERIEGRFARVRDKVLDKKRRG
jgi:hypothetical protein